MNQRGKEPLANDIHPLEKMRSSGHSRRSSDHRRRKFEDSAFKVPIKHSWKIVDWLHRKLDTQIDERHFYLCIGQKHLHISAYYFVFRWIMALLALTSSIITVGDIGNSLKLYKRDVKFYFQYFMYLSNITLTLCTITQIYGAVIVTIGAKKVGFNNGLPRTDGKVGRVRYMYWKIWEMTIMSSITVSVIYWLVVYQNADLVADWNAHLAHTFNSLYAVIDWWISGLPYNFSDLWIGWLYGFFFFLFNFIYWAAGGWARPNPLEETAASPVLYPGCSDYSKPAQATKCFVMFLGCMAIAHTSLSLMFYVKKKVALIHLKVHSRSTS